MSVSLSARYYENSRALTWAEMEDNLRWYGPGTHKNLGVSTFQFMALANGFQYWEIPMIVQRLTTYRTFACNPQSLNDVDNLSHLDRATFSSSKEQWFIEKVQGQAVSKPLTPVSVGFKEKNTRIPLYICYSDKLSIPCIRSASSITYQCNIVNFV